MLKKEILMVFRIAVIAVSLWCMSFGCSNQRELAAANVEKEMVITVTSLTPHCGGMAPLPGERYPKSAPMVNFTLDVFTIDNKGNRKEKVGSITTDENGKAKIVLPVGNYQLWRPDKLLSLQEFMDTNKTGRGDNYVYANEECFQKWKDTPDGEFKTYEDSYEIVYRRRCYVGANPCMEYRGPAAP